MSVSVAPAVSSSSSSTTTTTTASGWLALLQEDDTALRSAALTKLLQTVDSTWHEIAESLADLEALSEDDTAPKELCQTAAAVASRVFFHLQEPQQALRLALEAGPQYFDPMDTTSPYVERLVAAALDAYIQARRHQQEQDDETTKISLQDKNKPKTDDTLSLEQLQNMVFRFIQTSCQEQKYTHAVGIALETQHADQLRNILQQASSSNNSSTSTKESACEVWNYTLQSLQTAVPSKIFRLQALQVLADQAPTNVVSDLVKVYQMLGQPHQVAPVLKNLLCADKQDDVLLGLQLCFDLVDTGDQAFGQQVAKILQPEQQQQQQQPSDGGDDDANDATTVEHHKPLQQALRVLTGGFPSELALSFLHKTNHADRLIMEQLKKSLEERSSGSRSSVLHNAAVLTHSFLYAGTTNDSFLRDYLDWMKKASNWAKFSATASLGVVHAGHVTEAMHLLQPYLPSSENNAEVSASGGYAEGGSLYALGLMHAQPGTSATKRASTTEFLRNHLRTSHANEVISHGACLGVGLTAMGTAEYEIVKELKEVLDTDSAVAGEAAGIGMGLVLVGTGAGSSTTTTTTTDPALSELVAELKNYARETQHEKIIRGIAMGLALMQFGQEENADSVIEELRSDRDPILRYGAQYCIALAYCGTGSNKAIRLLLHTAVSDVSDDVRMAAVLGLAFVLYQTPERVPQLVRLLLESFNPHVRYASCMAVGIAMAGTGHAESVALLEPMLDDMTDYVRQGALMGTAMIYMQQTPSDRQLRLFRGKLATIVTEKHQSTLTKMGAILSTGILDSGGRNCALTLGSRTGFTKRTSAIGLALWLQHWHWFPMMHMWSLALTPTYTMGLNADFKYPKSFEIVCNAKPSTFAYPKKLEEKKEEKKKRVETVTLSTTAKEKARLARKRAKLGLDSSMEVDSDESKKKEEEETKKEEAEEEASKKKTEGKDNDDDDAMQVDESSDDNNKSKPATKKKREPSSFRISNPARMTKAQTAVCALDLEQRYRPIRPDRLGGVLMLTDSRPTEEDDEDLAAVLSPTDEPEGELPPPESFVWTAPPLPVVTEEESKTEKTSE